MADVTKDDGWGTEIHAWYSEKAAYFYSPIGGRAFNLVTPDNYIIYKNKEGKEIKCTSVSNSSTDSWVKWDDVQYMGPVVKFMKRNLH